MAGVEYEVLQARNIEMFREKVIQEGAQGWRVISMTIGPRGFFYAVMEKKAGA